MYSAFVLPSTKENCYIRTECEIKITDEDGQSMISGVPVTTAWRVLGLRMEERPPNMEGSCEYAVADSRQGVVQL
jgi:hypothetical protein